MTKVIISGINGFIGKALASRLIKKKYHVSGLGTHGQCSIQGVSYKKCDVLDKNTLLESTKNHDVYIHLAAITAHNNIVNHPIKTLQINWQGTNNMLESFTQNNGKHFIYASTGKVYGKFDSLPIRENHPPKPLNILGKSKYICERLIDFFYTIDPSRQYSILRIFNIYGESQKDSFLVPTIINQLESGTVNLGDIKAKRDYLYRDDLIGAFLRIMEHEKNKIDVYNVGSGKAHSAEEIANILGKIAGKKLVINANMEKYRKDELDVEYCSNKKLSTLGWKQTFTLEEGLRKTFNNS